MGVNSRINTISLSEGGKDRPPDRSIIKQAVVFTLFHSWKSHETTFREAFACFLFVLTNKIYIQVFSIGASKTR